MPESGGEVERRLKYLKAAVMMLLESDREQKKIRKTVQKIKITEIKEFLKGGKKQVLDVYLIRAFKADGLGISAMAHNLSVQEYRPLEAKHKVTTSLDYPSITHKILKRTCSTTEYCNNVIIM